MHFKHLGIIFLLNMTEVLKSMPPLNLSGHSIFYYNKYKIKYNYNTENYMLENCSQFKRPINAWKDMNYAEQNSEGHMF